MATAALISKKRILGQYYTRQSAWLYPQIKHFIKESGARAVVDPFAGGGHLLEVIKSEFPVDTFGLDIDPAAGWTVNNSLISIPHIENGLILTNPPYLSNYSAKRKGVYKEVEQYFSASPQHDDLYRIALDKCLEQNEYVVAIVPETFINSNYPKTRVVSITIVEQELFTDTETPVCIVCFGPAVVSKISIYKDSKFMADLQSLVRMQIVPTNLYNIKFNDPLGKIGLRAVDMPNPSKPISFLRSKDLNYDSRNIKISSRLITFVSLPANLSDKTDEIIERANCILADFRENTQDVLLSPFKGNDKNGVRRRRLDYSTARGILESAIQQEFQHGLKI